MNIVNYLTLKGYTSKEIDDILVKFLENGEALPEITSNMVKEAIEDYAYHIQENNSFFDYE